MLIVPQEKEFVIRRHREDGTYLYYVTNARGTIEWDTIEHARMLTPRQAALIENICIEEFWTVEVLPFRKSLF